MMSDATHKPVIFLAFANDRDDTVSYLRNLPDEARRLREVLEPAKKVGLCETVVLQNCTAGDIFKVFQDPQYRNRIGIFHYGGHANGYQLLLESPEGKASAADAGGLAAFLAEQQGLQLVFLNGCSTQQQTKELLDANISAVISTSRSIDDKVATDFACQFYQGLAGGATIRTSYNEAEAAVQMTKGGDTRGLYFGGTKDSENTSAQDRWPWNLYLREGSENIDQWNLPDAVDDPLFGLPQLPQLDLPDSPYRHLNWFTRNDAELFFGRGHQIRELYDRLTAPRTAPILLFYGQSGVGKSSILDAGLLPRLEQTCEVRYLRRGEGGLLDTLRRAFLPEAVDVPIETTWRVKEKQLQKPLIVFLDQVEELYTRPLADVHDELDQFLKVMQTIFSDPNHRPKGKLVLGFRKEWLAELEAQLVTYELPRTRMFLEPLDRRGIIEIVRGLTHTARLREKYGLTVEEGLAEIIADDLLEDRGSAIAPTLQILLTKTWAKATEANYEHPVFSQVLYQQLNRDGILLRDFLNQQIAAFRQYYPETVDSGLLLDIVALHTTPLGTADQCSVEQLQQQYAHLGAMLPAILQQCQDLHLLTVVASAQKESTKTTRLAHDTLAPLVREQFDTSDKPGQRARRILDNRSVDWADDQTGTPLDEADLKIVEQGASGTRALSATEQRLVDASRELRTRLQRTRKILKVVGALAVAVISGLGVFGWWNYNQADTARKDLTKTNDSLITKTQEAESNAREANRQKSNAYWQVGVIARDQGNIIKAGFNFLEAALACEKAGQPDDRIHQRNLEMAAQFATSNLVRTFPHDASCAGCRMSGNESHVLTWSWDGTVKLWDVTKPEPLQVWKHYGRVNGALFTRDESRVLAWSGETFGTGETKLWDVTKTEPLQVWKHDGDVRGAVFTRDETRVLAWSLDGAVKLWDVTKAEPLREWKHERHVQAAVFTRDESRILTWSRGLTGPGEVRLLDVKTAVPLQVWNYADVQGAVFTRDESLVLVWSGEAYAPGDMKLLDVTKAKPLQEWKHDEQVQGALFTRDESRVLAWSGQPNGPGELKLWDVTKTEPLQVWKHDYRVFGAVFTRDESRVLAWSGEAFGPGEVKLFDVTKAEPLQVWKQDHAVNGAVFTRDESRVLAWCGLAGGRGEVKLWDVTQAEPLQEWNHDSLLWGAEITRDASRVLSWSWDSAARLWDITKVEPLQMWNHPGIKGAMFSRDESHVLAWNWASVISSDVTLWDVTKAEPLQMWKHNGMVKGAVFARDASSVLSWSGDPINVGEVKLWDVTKAEPLQVWKHDSQAQGAVFTRDESRVLSWGWDGAVKLWDVTKAQPLQVRMHDHGVNGAMFTRDESRVLAWCGSPGGRGEVRLWHVTKTEPLQVWKHEWGVAGAVLSRDESRILAWSWDPEVSGDLTLWDVTKAEPLRVWKHVGLVQGAVFTRDESRILSWSFKLDGSGEVTLWDVTKAEPLQVWEHEGGVAGAAFTRDESRILAWSHVEVKLWDVKKAEPLLVWRHESGINGAVFTRDESRILSWCLKLDGSGEVTLWDVTKTEPLQVWKHKRRVNGAMFTRDESRILAWSGEEFGPGEVKLWDAALMDENLTLTERIQELQARSAKRLDSAGQLVSLKSDEWIKLVRSPEYTAIQKKKTADERSAPAK